MEQAAPQAHSQADPSSTEPQQDASNTHEDLDDELLEDDVTRWDEGGRSDCGYGDSVHDTLMSIGSTIHKVVGEPSEAVIETMNQIGNWFQEASYAARDLRQGNMNVGEETMQAVKSVVSGDDEDDDKLDPIAEVVSSEKN
ncbi:hypothetical protein ACHAW6_002673 [Cyclotella cf. meneghiniana]